MTVFFIQKNARANPSIKRPTTKSSLFQLEEEAKSKTYRAPTLIPIRETVACIFPIENRGGSFKVRIDSVVKRT